MADFEQALQGILSDPSAMEQIMELADRLGGDGPSPAQEETAPPEDASTMDAELLGQMGKLLTLFQNCRQTDTQTTALLQALRPFLREDRQQKLDKAVRLAGLSRTAQEAFKLWKEGELSV